MPSVGSVSVDVVPSLDRFGDQLRSKVTPQADSLGQQIGKMLADRIAKGIQDGVKDGMLPAPTESRSKGRESGDAFASEFEKQVQTKIRAALRALPDVKIDADSTDADRKIAELRTQLKDLGDQRIGVDISEDEARAKIEALRVELEKLGAESPSVEVRTNASAALAQVEALRAVLRGMRDEPVEVPVEANMGQFDRQLRETAAKAATALPELTIDADSTEAERKIAELRARLVELSDKRVGVDIDAAAAQAELERIKVDLDEVGARSPNVQVKTDTARASAQLAAFQAEVSALDGEEPEVKPKVDTNEGIQGIQLLIAAGVGLAPALIPVAAAVTAAFASIGAAATAAGAAIGVGLLAGTPVVKAFQALGAQQDSSGAAGLQSAAQAKARADAIVSANSQIQSSEASLSNARASAAAAAVNAAQRVSDAQRSAAQGVAQAELQVTQAEQSLTNAQQQQRNAQQALTDARKAAQQQLEDYKLQLADGALAQRAATLAIAQAKQTLDQVNGNQSSTDLQKQQAQLAYDQAVQQNTDLGVQQQRLKEQAAAAAKAGVDGSKQVQQAQANVTSTTQGVADAQSALARAQAGVVEAQRKGAEAVATAQRAQADQARQSAASIAAAQMSLANSQRSLAKAYDQTGTAGASAADKVKQAFAGLSPVGAEFTRFIFGLKDQFTGLSEAAQNGLLPGVQSFIQALLPALPQVTQFVGVLSKAMGDLFENAGKALTGPFWSQFFAFLAQQTPKWLVDFAGIMGNLVTGFAALFQALSPVGDLLTGMIAEGAREFADWAKGLMSSGGFASFLEYVKQSLPQVVQFFGAFFAAASNLVVALAPLGSVILQAVTAVLRFIAAIPPDQLALIATGIGGLVIGFQLILPLVSALGPVFAAITAEGATFGSVLAALGGPVTLVIVGLAALTVGLVEAYQHSETFRNIVNTAFVAVKNAVVVAWEQGIKPALTALWQFIQTQIMPTVRQLWTDVVQPAFKQIGETISNVWNNIVKPVLAALWWYIQNVLGPTIMWLLNNVVGPAFKGIAGIITFFWQNLISPTLSAFNTVVSALPTAFDAAVNGIRTAWNKLNDVIAGPVRAVMQFIKSYFVDPLNSALSAVGASFKIPFPSLSVAVANSSTPMGSVGRYASGGSVPGYSPHDRADNIPAWLTAGEFILPVRAADSLRSMIGDGGLESLRRGALPGYADGGIVDTVLGGLSRVGSTIASAISSAASGVMSAAQFAGQFATNPTSALNGLIAQIGPRLGTGPFPAMATGALSKMVAGITSSVSGLIGGSNAASGNPYTGPVPGGGSVNRWASIVLQALSIVGQPSSLMATTLRRLNQESGGNPNAINLWDSNARAGIPSKGLMQVIDPTFAAYRLPSLSGNIYDPLANIVASMRYAISRYGSLATAYNRAGGYANGGLVTDAGLRSMLGSTVPVFDNGGTLRPGYNLVDNQTGGPEHLRRVGDGEGFVLNIHPRANQSEWEIGNIAANQMMWRKGSRG